MEETISTCMSLKNLSDNQSHNLLEVTRFLTDSIKNLQSENEKLAALLSFSKSRITVLEQKINVFGLNRRTVYSYLKKLIKNCSGDLNTKETVQYILNYIKESYR
jgi:hypothetical protein